MTTRAPPHAGASHDTYPPKNYSTNLHKNDATNFYNNDTSNLYGNDAADFHKHDTNTLQKNDTKVSQYNEGIDRNQQFKFFDCIQALMKGCLPTNEQLDHMLSMFQNCTTLESRSHMLSGDGRELFNDFQELVRDTREIISKKNQLQLFQNFLYHCAQASDAATSIDPQAASSGADLTLNTAQKERREFYKNLKVIAKIITTSSEFNSILDEIIALGKEIFCEAADKVSQSAQRFGDKASAKAEDVKQDDTLTHENAGMSRAQADIRDATDTIQDTTEESKANPVGTSQSLRGGALQEASHLRQVVNQRASEVAKLLTGGGDGNNQIKEKAKAKTSEMGENLAGYATTKMPPERRQELTQRTKLIAVQVQSHPQYQEAVSSIVSLLKTWYNRSQDTTKQATNETGKVTKDQNVRIASTEFKMILERWAQDYSLDPMIQIIKNLWAQAKDDPDLAQYFEDFSLVLSKTAREPNYATSQAINGDMELLMDRGQNLVNSKYRSNLEQLLNEAQMFSEKLKTDPVVQKVSTTFKKVGGDLFFDNKGKFTFKPQLIDDLRFVILPLFADTIQSIAIPRIEYSDLKVDLMFDNMALPFRDLIPRTFEVEMRNSLRISRDSSDKSKDISMNEFRMVIQGIELKMNNVEYYIKTKEGFQFKDRGFADISIYKRGVDICIEGEKASDDSQTPSLINFKNVTVNIHSFSIKAHKSQHPVMNIFGKPFIRSVVKNAIVHTIESQIREGLIFGDRAVATSLRDQRIKTGKNTFGAMLSMVTSFFSNNVNLGKDKSKTSKVSKIKDRKKKPSRYTKTSHVIFDQDGLCVLDPVKHFELKIGQPLDVDSGEPAEMNTSAPWATPIFNIPETKNPDNDLPGVRRSRGTIAM